MAPSRLHPAFHEDEERHEVRTGICGSFTLRFTLITKLSAFLVEVEFQINLAI